MQPPTRKAEILDQIRATHRPLDAALNQLDPDRMCEPGVNGEWSVKDMLAHITWWEQHLLRRLRTGRDDLDDLYVEGVDDRSVTDRANADVFVANRDRPLAEVRADFDASYREVLAVIEAMADDVLATDDVYEGISWDTFRHYPAHTTMLTTWLESSTHGGA
ncbi:MAG TPA: DinB family protein [Ktedonobacterales bacterium]|nr:DinB family protein [Ktedonobacterales bacterium]